MLQDVKRPKEFSQKTKIGTLSCAKDTQFLDLQKYYTPTTISIQSKNHKKALKKRFVGITPKN